MQIEQPDRISIRLFSSEVGSDARPLQEPNRDDKEVRARLMGPRHRKRGLNRFLLECL